MDPLTAAAISSTLAPLLSGAAGEAGKAAWTSLAAWTRATFHRDRAALDAVTALELRADDAVAAQTLADRLATVARDDSAARSWLAAWQADAFTLTTVTNTVTGTVHGSVVQGNSFGSITFTTPGQG